MGELLTETSLYPVPHRHLTQGSNGAKRSGNMHFNEPAEPDLRLIGEPDVLADGCVIYRSGMNPKIHRNFKIFTPCDFIAAITAMSVVCLSSLLMILAQPNVEVT